MRFRTDVCDRCGKSITPKNIRTLVWDDRVQEIVLNGKGHIGVQKSLKYDLCTKCAKALFYKITQFVKEGGIKNEEKIINIS